MTTTQAKTIVKGLEEVKKTEVKKRKRVFFGLFSVEHWEVVSTEHIGNDIHIKTNREIRGVYLNGNKLKQNG